MEAYYRIYDLQWTPDARQEARFRRTLRNALAILLLLSLIVPWLPLPEKSAEEIPEIPQRFAKLLLERKMLPPPPPPVLRNEPEAVTEQVVREQSKPVEVTPQPIPDRTEKIRERASKAGLLPFAEALASLRSNEAVASVVSSKQLSRGSGIAKRTDRAVITSKVAGGSDGIRTSGFSRDTGGGGLAGRDTTTVVSTLGASGGGGTGNGSDRGGVAGRSLEEIEMVFDRNKGAIFALYNRALRKDPALQGKLVLRLTISPDGRVTFCEVVSSELGDAELERKLVTRVKMFRFDSKDVAPFTATKPIDFFPA